MTVREIQQLLEKVYGTEVSPNLISSITDAVVCEVKAWQSRPLDPIHPIDYLGCTQMKVLEGAARVKVVCVAIGITVADEKGIAGIEQAARRIEKRP